ncbi:MAG: cation:proton antiporter [Planctomycetota bacterium]
MTDVFATATIWLGLAILSAALAHRLRISIALMEICVGIMAAAAAFHFQADNILSADAEWLRFVAATGAILLTFLAGAELDPQSLRAKKWEVLVVGFIGFLGPFIGCAAVARFALGWNAQASWLAGVALSTTSMAVVYAVMLETGFNRTEFGKGILGACFVNDLGTVLALGFIFAPFTYRTLIFGVVCAVAFLALPPLTRRLTELYAHRTAAIRTKWVLFLLFGLGGLALWSGSEAVLPAYIAGMVLAGDFAQDEFLMRRLRTLTVGFLTPFYFIRAGALVSVPAILSAPLIFLLLFAGKTLSKIFGLAPVIGWFRRDAKEKWYYTLMMSTGLTFGTISALYGYSHGIVSREQYSFLVAVVIASAVIPTMIANFAFLPRHLLPAEAAEQPERIDTGKVAAEENP